MRPEDLTVPRAGSRTARDVLSAALRRLAGDLGRLRPAFPITPARAHDLGALRTAVADTLRREPGAVFAALRLPTVGAPLRVLRDGGGDDRVLAQLCATLGRELALAGVLPASLSVSAPPRRILSLTSRTSIDVPAGAAAITIDTGGVYVDGRRLGQEPAYAPIDGELVLALADDNPLAMLEAHPDKSGNALDLGGRAPEEWTASLSGALALVAEHLPDVRAAIGAAVRQFVPVGFEPEKHLSASYREAIGTVYLTLHPHPMTMAEAVVHEAQHNVLNALFETDDVLDDAWEPRHRSPVRPDLRPLAGVLLAVHAFVPIACLYERMIDAGHPLAAHGSFRRRLAEIAAKNHEGTETLRASARPTEAGAGLLDELYAWDARHAPHRA
jgi:HEXXH motif-containing protein